MPGGDDLEPENDPKARRRLILRFIFLSPVVLGAAALIVYWGMSRMKPSLDRAGIRTTRVEIGDMETNFIANGKVVPESEQVVASPMDGRVLKLYKRSGDCVSQGDTILQMDTGTLQEDLDRATQNLAPKQKELAKTRSDLDKLLTGIKEQQETKNAEIQDLRAKVEQNRNLFKDGVIAAGDVRRAEEEQARAEAEFRQLEDSKRNAESLTRAQDEQLSMEIDILEKEKGAADRILALATVKSDLGGVVTILTEEGAGVGKGDTLARVADTTSYRVQVRASDLLAGELTFGTPVRIRISGGGEFPGSVAGILPNTQIRSVVVEVALPDISDVPLRPDLVVQVILPGLRRQNVLRLPKGPASAGEGTHDMFVVRGSTAVKTHVMLGAASATHFEVLQGLSEGDEVIISDMSGYMHVQQVRIR
jgi:HlyD family secretion protein